MKKIFLSIAILATSVAAFAQTNNQQPTSTPTKTEQVKACKDNKACKGQQDRKNVNGRANYEARAFEGITLTDAQKSKLEALRSKEMNARKEARGDKNNGRDQKQKLTDEQKKQMKDERFSKRNDARKAHLAGIKEILTPEQYVVFLENTYVFSDNGARKPQAGKGVRGDQRGKKDMKGKKGFDGKKSRPDQKKG